jgi:pimeloyl-ACP methyl ester carboxylesterase
MDLRGHGESGQPTDPSDYTTEKMGQDILAVADACGIDEFIIWAMSFGGKISRYLAVQSERVTKYIMMGTPMGMGVSGERRQQAIDFRTHWTPILQAQRDGTLDMNSLTQNDRDFLDHYYVTVMLAWVQAMLDWPVIEPADFRCPSLWVVGSEDHHAIITLKEYEQALEGSMLQLYIVEGYDHNQVFDEIDAAYTKMLDFTTT